MSQAKTLQPAELELLIKAASHGTYPERDRLMVYLTYYAGLRVGEVAGLRICDVANADQTLKSEIRLQRFQTKGKKARTVMVALILRTEIAKYLEDTTAHLNTPLFVSQRSKSRFTPVGLANHFKKIYVRAGLDNGSSHSGRRTFITNLAASGVPVRVIQELAGHKHLATTQSYIDINDNDKRVAVEQLRC